MTPNERLAQLVLDVLAFTENKMHREWRIQLAEALLDALEAALSSAETPLCTSPPAETESAK